MIWDLTRDREVAEHEVVSCCGGMGATDGPAPGGIDGGACKKFRRDSFDVTTCSVARAKLRDLGGAPM